FNLLDIRLLDANGNPGDGLGQDGDGVDGFKGYNVLTFGLQIPVSSLPSFPFSSYFFGPQTGVGVYASTSRPQLRILTDSGEHQSLGPWIQTNRLANPFFNEGLVALRDKDNLNRSSPTQDAAAFATYAANPELAVLINTVFGTNFVTTGRNDLVNIFIP